MKWYDHVDLGNGDGTHTSFFAVQDESGAYDFFPRSNFDLLTTERQREFRLELRKGSYGVY